MTGDVPTIIVTRPEAQGMAFREEIRERLGDRASCVLSPVLKIVHLPLEKDARLYPTILFTSANGVRAFRAQATPSGQKAYCVGERTAEEARRVGFEAVTAGGNVDDLIDMVLHEAPPGPWLHVSGEHTRGNLADRLGRRGHSTDQAIAYRQDPVELSFEALDAIRTQRVVLPVFSPRTATLLSEMVPSDAPEPDVAAISAAAAERWRGPVRRLAIAAEPNSSAMLDILGMLVRTDSHS